MSSWSCFDCSEDPDASAESCLIAGADLDPYSIDELLKPRILDPDLPHELCSNIAESANRSVAPESWCGGDLSRPSGALRNAFLIAALLGRAYALLAGHGSGANHPYLGDLQENDYIGSEWIYAIGRLPWYEPDDVIKKQRRKLLVKKYKKPDLPPTDEVADEQTTSPILLFSTLPLELRLPIFEHYTIRLDQRRKLWSIISSTFIKAFFCGPESEPLSRYCAGILMLTCGRALSRTRRLIGKVSRTESGESP